MCKYFNGFAEPFNGTVDQHSDVTDFYHISYDDGDSEEMTEEDVETYFSELPNAGRTSKASQLMTLELTKATPARPTRKVYSPPHFKRARNESSSHESLLVPSVPPVAVEKGESQQRPKVLSLNANAPGLMHSIGATESLKDPSDNPQESLRVSIPTDPLEEEEEEEEEEEVIVVEDEDEEEDDDSLQNGTPEEINRLIGKPVERIVTKEGTGLDVVQGAVASYFPATKMFRVMYFDGECSDLTYHDVLKSIPQDLRPVECSEKKKRKANDTTRNGVKDNTPSALSPSPKRAKTLELNTKRTASLTRSSSLSSPLSPAIREADMSVIKNVELNIVRKVLYIIVSTVNNDMVTAQLKALSSADYKDETALELFVQKDGLVSLADLLTKWENQPETEQGLLLVLKVLAVLPGITKKAIMNSRIGKKVRVVEKRGAYKDSSIPGLAAWVIRKMKADVGAVKEDRVRHNGVSGGDSNNQSQGSDALGRRNNISPRGDAKHDNRQVEFEATDSPQLRTSKTSSLSSGSGFALKQSNSANHLQSLMNSRTNRDSNTARRDRDIFGNRLTSQNKRKLGTAQNWRARRSTVVLDQVTKRVSETAQVGIALKPTAVEDDDWRPSKISFAESDSVCPFDKEVEVSKLLVFRLSGSKAPERPVSKPHTGVLKSILRVRIPANSASQKQPRPIECHVAPKVHVSGRPVVEPIAVPSQRSSLGASGMAEDGTLESPMFDSSWQSKVVSPTEKRKQGFFPPPCVSTSEEPPLGFTEGNKEKEILNKVEVSANDKETGALVKKSEKFQSSVAVEVASSALSPVVSENESLEEAGASFNGADDSAPMTEAATLTSCSTGSKEGMEGGFCNSSFNQVDFNPASKCV